MRRHTGGVREHGPGRSGNGGREADGGETVVVTGASAGVGRATVRRFAGQGCRIGLLAREPDRLEDTRREVEELGGEALALPVDVADAEAVEEAARKVEEAFGPIDIWVNNAMVTVFSSFGDMKPEEFRRVTEVTYLGTVHGTRAALKRMQARNHGTVVQVGSALAYRSIPLQSAYCGAKSAIRGFTDSIRSELIHDGSDVHITMVQLPAVNTPQFEWCRTRFEQHPQPVPPIYEPEVAARAVTYAARHERREIVVGATAYMSILGQKVAPGFLDRHLARKAYEGQKAERPVDDDREDNLFEPAKAGWEARGTFDARAREHSPQLQANIHRGWLALGLGVVAAGVTALAARSVSE